MLVQRVKQIISTTSSDPADSNWAVSTPGGKMKGHIPGEAGIWVFVLGDLVVFGLFFSVFVYYRAQDPALYIQSQAALNQNYGAINTLFLLTSSWFVAMGIDAARKQNTRAAPILLGSAFLCGLGFAIVKILEYTEKIRAGITITTNDFYMFYYMLTGLHFVHVLIGMVVLSFVWKRSRRPVTKESDIALLESGATYWHMVDVLWFVLFPLTYLMK